MEETLVCPVGACQSESRSSEIAKIAAVGMQSLVEAWVNSHGSGLRTGLAE
jgi:hypothetical protein